MDSQPGVTSEPPQGATIEDKLRQILLVDGFYYDEPPEITAPLIAKLMKVITTETTKARIDELKVLVDFTKKHHLYDQDSAMKLNYHLTDRLAALQKEQHN